GAVGRGPRGAAGPGGPNGPERSGGSERGREVPPNSWTRPQLSMEFGNIRTPSSPGSTRCQSASRQASDEPLVTRTCSGVAPRYIAAIEERSSGVPFPCEYARG